RGLRRRRHNAGVIYEGWNALRRMSRFQLKTRETRGFIDRCHQVESDKGERLDPSTLLSVHLVAKTLVQGLVSTFARPVGFRMKCGRHLNLYPGQLVQSCPETGDEKLVAIRDEFQRQAIFAVPIVKEDRSAILSTHVQSAGSELNISPESIGHSKDAIEAV